MDEQPMPETLDTGDPPKTTEQKLDALSTSVDKRFDDVDEAFAEQRRYTEFAFDKLATEMQARFDKVDEKFDKVNGRFDKIDGKFDRIDGKFDRIDDRFSRIEGSFNRLERKLDQFIDTQSKANQLVERRLQALEPKQPQQ